MPNENSEADVRIRLETVQKLVHECLSLMGHSNAPSGAKHVPGLSDNISRNEIDFHMHVKAFIKKYGRGMSGPQQFTLLLSHIVTGDVAKEVSGQEVKRAWDKMTSKPLLGIEYHRSFPGRAIEYGWVNSKKRGFYNLEESWKDIFERKRGQVELPPIPRTGG